MDHWLPSTALVLVALVFQTQAFRDGDFIQTARKAQFHQQRTNWHDLLGHHCPRFGHDRLVAVPLQKPHLPLGELDEYKVQLSFDGDRHLTPWLRVLGKGAPAVPVIEVELRRSGEELLGVVATVHAAPISYQHAHAGLVEEFRNATHWPKHLLVRYRFKSENEVDLDRGLYVLFAAAVLVMAVMVVGAVQGAGPKLSAFLAEVTGEEGATNGAAHGGSGGWWKGGAKAE